MKQVCNVNKFCCSTTFGRIILKWALKKYVMRMWTGLIWLNMRASSGGGNKHSGSINVVILEYLRNQQSRSTILHVVSTTAIFIKHDVSIRLYGKRTSV